MLLAGGTVHRGRERVVAAKDVLWRQSLSKSPWRAGHVATRSIGAGVVKAKCRSPLLYCCIFVLILLYVCPHTTICVSSSCHVCSSKACAKASLKTKKTNNTRPPWNYDTNPTDLYAEECERRAAAGERQACPHAEGGVRTRLAAAPWPVTRAAVRRAQLDIQARLRRMPARTPGVCNSSCNRDAGDLYSERDDAHDLYENEGARRRTPHTHVAAVLHRHFGSPAPPPQQSQPQRESQREPYPPAKRYALPLAEVPAARTRSQELASENLQREPSPPHTRYALPLAEAPAATAASSRIASGRRRARWGDEVGTGAKGVAWWLQFGQQEHAYDAYCTSEREREQCSSGGSDVADLPLERRAPPSPLITFAHTVRCVWCVVLSQYVAVARVACRIRYEDT